MPTHNLIQPQAITERTKGWVVAHEPGTDILHPGEMAIIAWAVPYPDDQELQFEQCGETYPTCAFKVGETGRGCGLNFFIRTDSILQPVTFRRREARTACGQRPAARERE